MQVTGNPTASLSKASPPPLSFSPFSDPLPLGLSLCQLLNEVEVDQEHQKALVRLAESCLMLAGPDTAAPITPWAASRCRTTVSLELLLGNVGLGSWERVQTERSHPTGRSCVHCLQPTAAHL